MKGFQNNNVISKISYKYIILLFSAILLFDIIIGSDTKFCLENGIKILGIIILLGIYYFANKKIVLKGGVFEFQELLKQITYSLFSFNFSFYKKQFKDLFFKK